MATRKSEDEGRGTERGVAGDEHPGTYVQVVGTPRRRKSSAKQAAVADNDSNVERVGRAAAKYQQRLNDPPPAPPEERERAERTFASPRKGGVGPPGMEPAPTEAAPTVPREVPTATRESLKKTNLGIGPDLREQLERYAAEQASSSSARVERPQPVAAKPASEGRMRVVEIDATPAHIDTEGESDSDATNAFSRADVVAAAAESVPAPVTSSVPVLRPPSDPPPTVLVSAAALEATLPPPALDRASRGESMGRGSRTDMASVFDARPSIRPSDPVQSSSGPSWGMVVGIAILSSIIASAGVVALQELMSRREYREVPTVQVATRSARGEAKPAKPAPTVAAPVVAPAPVPPAAALPAPEAAPAEAVPVAPAVAAPAAEAQGPVATQLPAGERPRAQAPGRFAARSPMGVNARPAGKPVAAAGGASEQPRPVAAPKPGNRVMGGLVEPGSQPSAPAAPSGDEDLPGNPYAE